MNFVKPGLERRSPDVHGKPGREIIFALKQAAACGGGALLSQE
jgi:hypothetical protein